MNPVKRYLLQVRTLDERVVDARLALTEFQEKMAFGLSSPGYEERVQRSLKSDAPFARLIEKEADIELAYRQIAEESEERKILIMQQIYRIGDANMERLLILHYFRKYSLDRIADEMGYSRDHINRMHGRALKRFEEVNPNYANKCQK